MTQDLKGGGGVRGQGGRTEDGIDDMISRLQRGRKVIHEGDVEVFQLFRESLRTRISGLQSEGRKS